jgi:hypothetical protein
MPLGTFPKDAGGVHQVCCACGPDNTGTIQHGWFSLVTTGPKAGARGHIWFTTTADWFGGQGGSVIHEEDWQIPVNTRKSWQCPDNTDSIVVQIVEADQAVAWYLELQAK